MAYSREQIQQLFQSQFDLTKWTDVIINFFKAREVNRTPVPLDINPSEGQGYELGYLDTTDTYRISFFYLKLNRSVDQRKVGLRQMIERYIKIDSDAGIGVFDDGNHWRLSFITDLRGEKTSPKRYTFVFGKSGNGYRTAVDRFMELQRKGISFTNIKEAFSVEALTKQFYNDLFDWYTWALKEDTGVYFPNNPNTPADDREGLDTKMIRLITRLMFVWFIKQKGLVPDALFNPEEVEHWLKEFDAQSMESANYYQAILQNLFFATLNRPIKTITYDKDGNEQVERRGFAHLQGKQDVKSLYRYEELFKINKDKILSIFEFIPFINGGLFECLDKNKTSDGVDHAYFEDGFSRNSTIKDGRWTKRAFVPNKLFFDPEDGIISIFNRYNFTVEENSPSEQQIALDPELLGKVFENLLGVYNPETHDTARSQSGSFYTPREIVNYMVDRSLEAYLGNTDEVKALFRDDFVYYESKRTFYDEIIAKLKAIKVLDPACGSGAFPMGMLNRIVGIMQNLNAPGNKYDQKLEIMENCIFGGDIQTIAAQITKLRFFISLVCDCKKTDNADENYGIPNLPNLETHFVSADSLGSLERPQQLSLFEQDVIELKKKLQEVRHEHFTAKTVYQKNKLRNRDKELREELAQMLASDNVIANKDTHQLVAWNPYDQNCRASFFDSEWMFGIKDGFDVVIGNPPYLKEGKANKKNFDSIRGSRYYQGKMDLWYAFASKAIIEWCKKRGLLCFIATNNWVTNAGSSILRKDVVTETRILQMCDFSDFMIFESASIQTMIMLFEKNNEIDNYCFDYRTLTGKTTIQDVNDLLAKNANTSARYLSPLFKRDRYKDAYLTFSTQDDLLEKLKSHPYRLTDSEATNGIHPHYDFVNNKIKRAHPFTIVGEGIFGLSECEKIKLHLNEDELHLIKPYYTSEEVKRFYTESKNGLWIIYTDSSFKDPHSMDSYPHIKTHLDRFKDVISSDNKPYGLHRARKEDFFKGEKIAVLRKCVGKPSFSYSDFDCYLSATFNIIKTSRWNMKFLTGLLNSKVVTFWLRNKGKMQGGNFQLDKEPLLNIPLISPTVNQQPIVDLIEKIISEKRQNSDFDASPYETEIDHLVYELYGLTNREVKIIDPLEDVAGLEEDNYEASQHKKVK